MTPLLTISDFADLLKLLSVLPPAQYQKKVQKSVKKSTNFSWKKYKKVHFDNIPHLSFMIKIATEYGKYLLEFKKWMTHPWQHTKCCSAVLPWPKLPLRNYTGGVGILRRLWNYISHSKLFPTPSMERDKGVVLKDILQITYYQNLI